MSTGSCCPGGRFDTFHAHIKAYGVWQILRNTIIKHIRSVHTARAENRKIPKSPISHPRAGSEADVDRGTDLAVALSAKLVQNFVAASRHERSVILSKQSGLLHLMQVLGGALDGADVSKHRALWSGGEHRAGDDRDRGHAARGSRAHPNPGPLWSDDLLDSKDAAAALGARTPTAGGACASVLGCGALGAL